MKTNGTKYDLVVVGGGPSGMMMAGRAAELGARVLLIEKNKQLGNKLRITGGGRCNITNATFNIREFLDNFPQSKQFLFSPFSKFSAKDTFDFFERKGLPLVVEARKRAFPQSQEAADVFYTLERYMRDNGVEIRKDVRISTINTENDRVTSVVTKKDEVIHGNAFAIATGGTAAPRTGSTGDGFTMLEKLGHTIHKSNPNVVPLTSDAKWVHNLSGVTLSFMTIRFLQKDKIKLKKTGKILFTHFGVSGPLILNSAFEVKKLLARGPVEASIDLFPDTEENELDRRVWRLFEKNKNKTLKNILPELLPKLLSAELLSLPSIDMTEHKVHDITKEERKKLIKKMKDLRFKITGTLGFEKAVITDGGVDMQEIDFKNISSKKYPNLYVLGDMLHINRPSGGFSLQLCWTTGWVAGSDIKNIKQAESK